MEAASGALAARRGAHPSIRASLPGSRRSDAGHPASCRRPALSRLSPQPCLPGRELRRGRALISRSEGLLDLRAECRVPGGDPRTAPGAFANNSPYCSGTAGRSNSCPPSFRRRELRRARRGDLSNLRRTAALARSRDFCMSRPYALRLRTLLGRLELPRSRSQPQATRSGPQQISWGSQGMRALRGR